MNYLLTLPEAKEQNSEISSRTDSGWKATKQESIHTLPPSIHLKKQITVGFEKIVEPQMTAGETNEVFVPL